MATMPNTNINIPYSAFIDDSTGRPTQAWLLWLMNPNFISVNIGSALPVTSGGTGLTTIPTNGQLLIGNGTGYTLNTLGTGAGISVTNAAGTITVTNTGVLSWSGGTTGLTPATATTGVVTLSGTLGIANGGTNGSATPTAGAVAYGTGTAYGFTAAGTSGYFLKSQAAGIPIWSNDIGGYIVDGSAPYLDWGNGSAVTLAAGRMWYDGSTGAWNLGMGGGNITQQVGEELFVYGKASAAITDSPLQIVYHTGTVGASGVIKFAPTIAGLTDVNAIVGVATESLALNGFGRVTSFGVVRGITTNGTAFGEVWADDDVIWYNPVTGNPTKVAPVAPYIKVQVGLVIKAGAGGSGSFQVNISRGSTLGGTDSNVQISAPSNGQILTYDGSATYWKNTTLTAGTGVSISPSAGGVLTISATGSGGTVTSVSVVSANGFAGTVATATTTPAITLTTSVTGVLKGNGTAISAAVVNTDYLAPSAPVTKTANFTVADTDVWLINNKTGSTCTATLPAASSWTGRVLRFLNYQAQTVVSASSNVVPLTGGSAATSILLASTGDSATLVSDGTNWLMTQYIPNNILLLE